MIYNEKFSSNEPNKLNICYNNFLLSSGAKMIITKGYPAREQASFIGRQLTT